MLLLLTERAFVDWGDLVGAAAPEVRFVRMQGDGSLVFGDRPLDWADAHPDVAWLTADVFDTGLARKFIRLTLDCKPQWLQSAGAGIDHPVFQMVLDRGTRLTTSHVTGVPIAEYVVRSVLDHYQQPERWAEAREARRWTGHDFREIAGTTWLVVGLGSIGREVAVRAAAFGATTIGVRRRPGPDDPVDECVRPDRLDAVLPRADVIVLAAPGGPETRHLIDARALATCKAGSVLVNVGRGSLVDEDALHDALDRGKPEVAILDVTDEEPPADGSWLWTHPRVVLTPHTSAGGTGRYRRAAEVFAANLARYREGQPLLYEEPAGP